MSLHVFFTFLTVTIWAQFGHTREGMERVHSNSTNHDRNLTGQGKRKRSCLRFTIRYALPFFYTMQYNCTQQITRRGFMTKTDLIEKMAEASGCTKACAGKALDGAVEAITKAVKKGDKVALVGFGTF